MLEGLFNLITLVLVPGAVFAIVLTRKKNNLIFVIVFGAIMILYSCLEHPLCALVYSFCVIGYWIYVSNKYVKDKKSTYTQFDEFREYLYDNGANYDDLYNRIFHGEKNSKASNEYKKEFEKFFEEMDKNKSKKSNFYSDTPYGNRYKSEQFTQKENKTSYSYRKDYSKTTTARNTDEHFNREAADMGLRYFVKCMNCEEAKRVYHKYAVKYHPDNPQTGNKDKFVEIDQQYNTFMETFKDR